VAKQKAAVNPFYVVLVIAGVVFCITACAYGVMALQGIRGNNAPAPDSPGARLLVFMNLHGETLLIAELAVLALATFAAMGTDQFWQRRADRRARSDSSDDA
jgi:hypothetical protein